MYFLKNILLEIRYRQENKEFGDSIEQKHFIIINETFNNFCVNNIVFCSDWIQIRIDN
jgi:hypothetical protein